MTLRSNLLHKRLLRQKTACENLFGQVHYVCCEPEFRLNIDCYYLKLDDFGEPRIRDLVQYLARMLTQYTHTLAEFVEAYEEIDPFKVQELSIEALRLLVAKRKQGDLGEFILWMLIEGIVGVPKILTKHPHKSNTNMQNFGSDGVHASYDHEDDELILYIGESKLRANIKTSITEAIDSVYDHFRVKSGKRAIDQDIFLIDHFAVNDINDQKLASAIKEFSKPDSSTRANTKYLINVFTGYDSKKLKALKSIHYTKIDDFIKNEILLEAKEIAETIKTSFSTSPIHKFRIIWFVLPFDTVKDFEKTFIAETRGEYVDDDDE